MRRMENSTLGDLLEVPGQAGILSGLLRVFTAFLTQYTVEQGIIMNRINFTLRERSRGDGAKRHMLKKKKIFFYETHCNNGKNWLVLQGVWQCLCGFCRVSAALEGLTMREGMQFCNRRMVWLTVRTFSISWGGVAVLPTMAFGGKCS